MLKHFHQCLLVEYIFVLDYQDTNEQLLHLIIKLHYTYFEFVHILHVSSIYEVKWDAS